MKWGIPVSAYSSEVNQDFYSLSHIFTEDEKLNETKKPRMSRRKTDRKAKGDANGIPAVKKQCLSPQICGVDVRLEWEGDKSAWTRYAHTFNSGMIRAFNTGEKEYEFEIVDGPEMHIRLDTMVQRNKKTGWERRIRSCVRDNSDGVYYVWQWTDEKDLWNPYEIKTSVDLELAFKSEDEALDVEAAGRSYTISLKNMEQTNKVTNASKKIARIKSETEETSDVEPCDPPAVKSSRRKVTSAKSKVKEELEDEEEGNTKPATKTQARSAVSKSKGRKVEECKEDVRGTAPVDAECPTMMNKAHIFCQGKDIWDCMLNQTNLSNNNNKFYLIQLLEDNKQKHYHVWQRWGRVGYKGQTNLVPCDSDLEKAKGVFTKKFSDKTQNNWVNRQKFVKVPGKYDLLEMDYSPKDEPDAASSVSLKSDVSLPGSKIDERLQDLINLICDIKLMEEAVVEMKYDAKKAPLGKLTTDQITAGYAALKNIDTCIGKQDFGSSLVQACDEFYTRIPHSFGMKQPPLIREKHTVEQKMQLLEALGDIEIAIKTLKKGDMSENPVDRHYHALDCQLDPIEKTSVMYKIINQYLQNTHTSTHNQYKMEIIDMFEVDKLGETEKFTDRGNRMLLWHGSRLTNWVGILSQGLRIAPPEAPVTGYMFGKGVYFSDMSSKSANYCFATRYKNTGMLLLSEVALGESNELLAADYRADKLPTGKHSVKGVGSIAPDPSKIHKMENGTVVPLGKSKDTNVVNPNGYTLNYNEFIVYNREQIKMKYLLKIKFNFK